MMNGLRRVALALLRLTATHTEDSMKLEWHQPVVTEQQVGLEVTSYASAELGR